MEMTQISHKTISGDDRYHLFGNGDLLGYAIRKEGKFRFVTSFGHKMEIFLSDESVPVTMRDLKEALRVKLEGVTSEDELWASFVDLAGQRSPENLTGDGELSGYAVTQRLKKIKREWKKLEGQLGREVNEEEVWRWYRDLRGVK